MNSKLLYAGVYGRLTNFASKKISDKIKKN